MTAKILGGLAAAILVIGIGAYAAGVGGTNCPFSGGCDASAPSQCSLKATSSCCSMSDEATLSAAEQQTTTESKSDCAKKTCCSEKE